MPANFSKAHEVDYGLKVIDGPLFVGGSSPPTSLVDNFPVDSIYYQTVSTGTVIWRKYGTNTADWVKLMQNDFYQKSVNETEQSTTSNSVYTTQVTLTTPNLPLGNYILRFKFKIKVGTADRGMDIRVQDNSVDKITTIEYFPTSATPYTSRGGFINLDGISGVRTITLQFKRNGNQNATVFMSAAALELVRES